MADHLRWGILGGASWIARDAVMPAIQRSRNGRVTTVASRDPAKTAPTLKHLGDFRYCGYEELLAAKDVDAIYIPLPNSMHAEWCIKAAEAGKAVLCDKPLAMNAAETERVVAAFAKANVPLMENFMYRFHPQHARVREMIDSGLIGEVREARTHLSVDLMSPPDLNNIRMIPAMGGGALLDMGCYMISAARMLMQSEPLKMRAWWKIDPQTGVDIACAGVMEFSGGRVALVSCSFEATANGHYSVTGTKGVIEAPRALILGLGTRVKEALIVHMDADGKRSEEIIPAADHYQLAAEAFAGAVLAGKPVPLPPQESIANMRAIDAFARSAREGREVAV